MRHRPNSHDYAGFTLIELMIVVAIIGILAAIAIPAYQDYTIRAQVSEGLTLLDGAKTAVATYYTDHGTFPSSNASAGLASPSSIAGNYVSRVSILHDPANGLGALEVVYGHNANKAISGDGLLLIPTTTAGSIAWTCLSYPSVPGGMPAGFPGGVPNKYLPSSCRLASPP